MTAGAGGKNTLVIRKKEEGKGDLVSLGEVMLRLDPGDVRVAETRRFKVWGGGGDNHGARGLGHCFWFETSSGSKPEVAKEAMVAARKHGVMISYDLNYRDSLWKSIGGKARATEVNRELASYVDVMIGNEEDFTAALGFEIEGVGEDLGELDSGSFRRMIEKAVATFPNFRAVATTLRHAKTASINDWGAVCYYEGPFHEPPPTPDLAISAR